MNRLLMIALAALGLVAATGGIAAAQNCNEVEIHVRNPIDSQPYEVTDFDYWDDEDGQWREEDLVQDHYLAPGDDWVYIRDLERVGEENGVIIRVQHRHLLANGTWHEHESVSPTFHCDDGDHIHIDLE